MSADHEFLSPAADARPLFRPAATTLFRVVLLSVFLGLGVIAYAGFEYYHSPAWNRVEYALDLRIRPYPRLDARPDGDRTALE